MTYSDATGSYQADFLENILDTDFRYGLPYKIDREKYEAVMKEFNKEIRVKDADVVVFHADYNKDDDEPEREIYSFAFFAWPQNSPEGSDDFYDCSQFWDYDYDCKHKEKFESFVRAILETVIGPDQEHVNKLKAEKIKEKREIERQIADIDNIYREHFVPKTDTKKKCCKDCWHNYHCPMPQEGYDYDPDTCEWNPDNRQEKAMKEWRDENMSHGAFALTQDEIDFYHKPKK